MGSEIYIVATGRLWELTTGAFSDSIIFHRLIHFMQSSGLSARESGQRHSSGGVPLEAQHLFGGRSFGRWSYFDEHILAVWTQWFEWWGFQVRLLLGCLGHKFILVWLLTKSFWSDCMHPARSICNFRAMIPSSEALGCLDIQHHCHPRIPSWKSSRSVYQAWTKNGVGTAGGWCQPICHAGIPPSQKVILIPLIPAGFSQWQDKLSSMERAWDQICRPEGLWMPFTAPKWPWDLVENPKNSIERTLGFQLDDRSCTRRMNADQDWLDAQMLLLLLLL